MLEGGVGRYCSLEAPATIRPLAFTAIEGKSHCVLIEPQVLSETADHESTFTVGDHEDPSEVRE